jgi:leucyl-tRNA synthetase
VSEDIEQFHFNKAVARCRELSNAIQDQLKKSESSAEILQEAVETLLKLLNPFLPHFTEECWEQLGHSTWLVDTDWPEADPSLLQEDTVTLAIQVNGKLRGKIDMPKGHSKEDAETQALKEENVARFLSDKTIRKVIVVPNKIVNVVAA